MLRLEQLSLTRGSRDLFSDLDWRLDDRERIGLVGPNGSGKSSLLKVMAGEVDPDGGQVVLDRGVRVGYLPQEGLHHAGRSLFDEALSGMTTLKTLERTIERTVKVMQTLEHDDPKHKKALSEHEKAETRFRAMGGYAMEAQVGRVLRGLGFEDTDLERDCSEFSGGKQMRIALAKLLLEQPEVLLLDEPTNHLDIESRIWLEHFLMEYPGAVIIVSHDRSFLDRVVRRICELSGGALTVYTGTFSQYLTDREERLEQLRSAHAQQQEEIRRAELFIRRFRAKNTKASVVQSRIKMLERMDRIELPPTEERIRFRFDEATRCGPWPLTLRGVSKSYGDLKVLEEADLTIGRKERVALVGPNGAGKSTLLRMMAGREELSGGELDVDRNVRMAFFAQDQAEELPPKVSVLDAVREAVPQVSLARVRSTLGAFLFRGDDVHKKCGVLSGGERNRVALVRVLLSKANLLLLDEPTNHLDLQAKESLQEALLAFDGCVIFVSHDRGFVEAVAGAVVEVGGLKAERFDMGFEAFLWKRAFDLGYTGVHAAGKPAPDLWFLRGTEYFGAEEGGDEPATEAEKKGMSYGDRKKLQRRIRALERKVEQLEQQSEEAATRIREIDAKMVDPSMARDVSGLMELQEERDRLQAEGAEITAAWEAGLTELDELNCQLFDA